MKMLRPIAPIALALALTGCSLGSLLGGGGNDVAFGVAVAPDRSMWVGGFTSSDSFPLVSALDSTRGGQDGFLTKLNTSGTPVFSTYWGGAGSEIVLSVTTAANGESRSQRRPTRSGSARIRNMRPRPIG